MDGMGNGRRRAATPGRRRTGGERSLASRIGLLGAAFLSAWVPSCAGNSSEESGLDNAKFNMANYVVTRPGMRSFASLGRWSCDEAHVPPGSSQRVRCRLVGEGDSPPIVVYCPTVRGLECRDRAR